MKLEDKLSKRISNGDIIAICELSKNSGGRDMLDQLYSLIGNTDDRVGYNALWIFTHSGNEGVIYLQTKRNELIDMILRAEHTGKRRLLLTLVNQLKCDQDSIRSDYLDFCLSKINSTEPYAIRALCLKEAYSQCRFYPELMNELKLEIEMMSLGNLSPGLVSAKNQICKLMNKLR